MADSGKIAVVVVFAHPPIPAGLSLFICQSAPLNLTSAEIGCLRGALLA